MISDSNKLTNCDWDDQSHDFHERGAIKPMFQKIVMPIDLEDENSWRKALPVAVDYAVHAEAELHVLTVVPDHMLRMTFVAQLIPEGYEENLLEDAKDRLTQLLDDELPDGQPVQKVVRLGSIHKEIMRYARDIDADLIIMGTHRPEISDYLLGPNAAHVVRHADCSVWTIRE